MASLMEELITVLSREKEIYEKLIPISERKTVVLIREDLQELQKVTDEEQQLLDAAYAADKKREKIIENIGIVLNRDPKELDLTTLARLMARQPAEKKQLSELHDSLKLVMDRLVNVNQKNKELIENSLEMILFKVHGCHRGAIITIAMHPAATALIWDRELLMQNSDLIILSQSCGWLGSVYRLILPIVRHP